MHGRSCDSPTRSGKKRRHRDGRSRSPISQFIKSEPVDDNFRTLRKLETDHNRHPARGNRYYEHRPSSKDHRLREPVVIKEEDNPGRRPRLHSPKILRDEGTGSETIHSHRRAHRNEKASYSSSLGRSGLLDRPSAAPVQKQRANFGLSGKLTEDTNTYKGVVIKYNEPEDARKPTEKWRLYAFKGNQTLPILHIHRQSGFLIGRDRKIADIPMDHPSISKQHAVLQYRFVSFLIRYPFSIR
ncbi:Smad nuclear-interacting protein 1 [Fasciola gigantica]|uniref:Smad nuclear-interacting protein 1 n=1 Tax=Fasciola gigantica TaxID=46835 RepID=A0A504Z4M5_FASGI|nr:Smad nuclear-interacting protein 1 [Fasciola gigantica]